jgi:hypothetical protein
MLRLPRSWRCGEVVQRRVYSVGVLKNAKVSPAAIAS